MAPGPALAGAASARRPELVGPAPHHNRLQRIAGHARSRPEPCDSAAKRRRKPQFPDLRKPKSSLETTEYKAHEKDFRCFARHIRTVVCPGRFSVSAKPRRRVVSLL